MWYVAGICYILIHITNKCDTVMSVSELTFKNNTLIQYQLLLLSIMNQLSEKNNDNAQILCCCPNVSN